LQSRETANYSSGPLIKLVLKQIFAELDELL
jgi:hypothetical protein